MDVGFMIILVLILVVGNDIVCEGVGSGGYLVFFVFGDLLVDIGNNNYLVIIVSVDLFFYGVDYFIYCFIGCFFNGFNIFDLISKIFIVFLICFMLIMFMYVNVNILMFFVMF